MKKAFRLKIIGDRLSFFEQLYRDIEICFDWMTVFGFDPDISLVEHTIRYQGQERIGKNTIYKYAMDRSTHNKNISIEMAYTMIKLAGADMSKYSHLVEEVWEYVDKNGNRIIIEKE